MGNLLFDFCRSACLGSDLEETVEICLIARFSDDYEERNEEVVVVVEGREASG